MCVCVGRGGGADWEGGLEEIWKEWNTKFGTNVCWKSWEKKKIVDGIDEKYVDQSKTENGNE